MSSKSPGTLTLPPGTIRTVAAHEVVRAAFPRPVLEGQEVALAAGRAIDEALLRYSHDHAQGRRPGVTAMVAHAASVFDDAVAAAGAEVLPSDRERALAPVPAVLRAFRSSPLFGLPRPRSRLIVINSVAGVYAQPDFWDGRSWIYEMKSYRAVPPRPDVALQLRLFGLAFPRLRVALVYFDRHADPVTWGVDETLPPGPEQVTEDLRLAYGVALRSGTEKRLDYVDAPQVPYVVDV